MCDRTLIFSVTCVGTRKKMNRCTNLQSSIVLLEGDHLEDLGVNGMIILQGILNRMVGWEGLDYINLAEARDNWWTLVNTVMNCSYNTDKMHLTFTFYYILIFFSNGSIAPWGA